MANVFYLTKAVRWSTGNIGIRPVLNSADKGERGQETV